MTKEFIIYSDGGSRGNPGPAAAAYVIRNARGLTLAESGVYLGLATNNVAEYQALIQALERAAQLGGQKVRCFLDSELVVKQLNGQYRVKEEKMGRLFGELSKIIKNFQKVSFHHVPRTQNRRADQLVNRTLDGRG